MIITSIDVDVLLELRKKRRILNRYIFLLGLPNGQLGPRNLRL
jgi:hypothetical protein